MWTDDFDESLEDAELPPSKSQLKRDSTARQDLGKELIELPREQLKRLNLPPELMDAVLLGQTITAHGGLRRQRKYIGKLLRDLDPEPIRQELAALYSVSAAVVRLQHQCERWRDRMLAEGDPAVNGFVAEHPGVDRQKLRQWARDGRREREEGQPPRAARLLFRYLREVLAETEDDSAPTPQEDWSDDD